MRKYLLSIVTKQISILRSFHAELVSKTLKRDKGPFKYYVSKKVGGWGWPNAYVCLQGGWVGLAKCLRNHKNHQKRPNGPR